MAGAAIVSMRLVRDSPRKGSFERETDRPLGTRGADLGIKKGYRGGLGVSSEPMKPDA